MLNQTHVLSALTAWLVAETETKNSTEFELELNVKVFDLESLKNVPIGQVI